MEGPEPTSQNLAIVPASSILRTLSQSELIEIMRHITPRRTSSLFFAALAVLVSLPQLSQAQVGLVSTVRAERLGLERSWFSQVQFDFTRYRVKTAILDRGSLFVLADSGICHAMDAETGKTQWVARFGNPEYPTLGPAANEKYVAVVNGGTLYILDRNTGREFATHKLDGGVGGGPALTEEYAFVPMFTGKLEAFSLGEPRDYPWYYASTGRVFDAPTATPDSVVWPTDRGYLYVANPAANGVRYRFESSGRVIGHPSSVDGVLYLASSNGYLYAVSELNGHQLWRYSTGSPGSKAPLVVAGVAYVPTEEPTLHAVNCQGGTIKWIAPGVSRVAGVGKSRVYGMNRVGELISLDANSGVPMGKLKTCHSTMTVANSTNDRIYLVTATGLVQCLHEVGSDTPLLHDTTAAAVEEEPAKPANRADETPEVDTTQPEEKPEPSPFGGNDDDPFGGGMNNDNPFGF